ncbi:MAG: hypothetical protein RLZZ70_102 [Candidatus Parcubacteria bacterium]|jgi:hypothetical protein
MVGDSWRSSVTSQLAIAWGLYRLSDTELREEAADWGYGDCPQRFVDDVYALFGA